MKIRDILQEKATLIAIPLSKFNMFFNNYILKKIAKNTSKKSKCRQFKQCNTYWCGNSWEFVQTPPIELQNSKAPEFTPTDL